MTNLTYPHYLQRSGWNALLPTRQSKPPLSLDIKVDVAIIGAGYTGIAAAKRWRELAPDDEIAIIDASELGEGTPGRNSGFLLEIALANDANPEQIRRMRECNRLIGQTMNKIVREVEISGIDCALERTGTYRAAAGNAGRKSLLQYRSFLQAVGLPFENLDRQAMQQRLGTSFYRQGLYSPHCYLAQPAALIKALAQQLPRDIQCYENTPATQLRKAGNAWLIETPAATIEAQTVILANNAFSKTLGIGKSQLVAVYTYAAITKPLDEAMLASLGSDKSWGVLPAHRLGSTLRKTQDGRLMVRSFYGYEKETQTVAVTSELRKNLLRRFPQLEDTPFDRVWGGAIGFTMNGGTLWGEVKPGLFVSAGCNGGGVVKGTLFGELLADLANGQEVPDVPKLFGKANWIPPEPWRAIGFHLLAAVERFRGRAEI